MSLNCFDQFGLNFPLYLLNLSDKAKKSSYCLLSVSSNLIQEISDLTRSTFLPSSDFIKFKIRSLFPPAFVNSLLIALSCSQYTSLAGKKIALKIEA